MKKFNTIILLKYASIFFVFIIFLLNQLEIILDGQGDIRNYKFLIELKLIGSQITEPFLKFLIIIFYYFSNSSVIHYYQ